MDEHKTKMYPEELILNKENEHDKRCTFLDIDISINRNKTITTKIYDKRDDFNFTINNFPNLSGNIHNARSHGIVISQLIRYCKVCMESKDFITRIKTMMEKLVSQYFDLTLLRKKFCTFYDKYYHLIEKYEHTKLNLCDTIFNVV